jgi:hypothetical protein
VEEVIERKGQWGTQEKGRDRRERKGRYSKKLVRNKWGEIQGKEREDRTWERWTKERRRKQNERNA